MIYIVTTSPSNNHSIDKEIKFELIIDRIIALIIKENKCNKINKKIFLEKIKEEFKQFIDTKYNK